MTSTLSASRHRAAVHCEWTSLPSEGAAVTRRTHRTLTGTVPTVLLAAITFDFDPFVRVGDSGVRLDTIALAASILVALVIAAVLAARTTIHDPQVPAWSTAAVDLHLRRDDLLFIVLGVIPGAGIGARLGYVLIHLDYYSANPTAVLDPNQGSLELGLAVLVGTVTGAYVGRLLDAPVGRWLHVAAIPLLVGLALGELSRALGGGGQGSASDVPWATAYAGPGPWDTLVPAIPAHPAQVYGALAALVALGVVLLVKRLGGFQAHDGSAFFVGLLVWALGRTLVTFAWRDDVVVGPLRAGALVALGVAAASVAGLVLVRLATTRRRRQAHGRQAPGTEPVPDWPDPATRPRF
jgi:prolipoprotein diacylglyceryltransferase